MTESLAEILPELHPSVMCKAELVRNELGYIAQDISKQSVGDAACFLVAYSKMQEEIH